MQDYLVIGTGIAGLTFALEAAKHGSVLILTKERATDSNTQWAQGGIAVALSPSDSTESHVADTLNAGAGLCKIDAVSQIVREGPNAVRTLVQRGVAFTLARDGTFDLGREGGHSCNRVAYATDITGREVVHALLDAVRNNPRITVREYHTVVDLMVDPTSMRCTGAFVLVRQHGAIIHCAARATVLATGGAGQVYERTTNPAVATGDGIALAYRAGATVANLEFVQFHPTMLAHPGARSFLISEAVRGFGAELVRRDGSPFMKNQHPMGSLAPRDIVARAIHHEMRRTGEASVWLDIRHRRAADVRKRFPHLHAYCMTLDLDMARELIPVVPAAHYMCGGVATDLEGRTTVSGLYAIGECACTGAHGANRLASNSLLEGLVFARHAAEAVRREPSGDSVPRAASMMQHSPNASEPDVDLYPALAELRSKLGRLVWERAGIVRNDSGLRSAMESIVNLTDEFNSMSRRSSTTTAGIELRNLLLCAELISRSALRREESRGTHFNEDWPNADPRMAQCDTLFRDNRSTLQLRSRTAEPLLD